MHGAASSGSSRKSGNAEESVLLPALRRPGRTKSETKRVSGLEFIVEEEEEDRNTPDESPSRASDRIPSSNRFPSHESATSGACPSGKSGASGKSLSPPPSERSDPESDIEDDDNATPPLEPDQPELEQYVPIDPAEAAARAMAARAMQEKRRHSKERLQQMRRNERMRLVGKNKKAGFSMNDVSETEMETARLYLKRVADVNNHLHTATVNKRIVVDALQVEITQLELKLTIGQSVGEPARSTCITRCEELIETEQSLTQSANLELGNSVMQWEDSVGALTDKNAQLREAGLQNRQRLREQAAEIQRLRSNVRDVRRHIEILEGGDWAEGDDDGPGEFTGSKITPGGNLLDEVHAMSDWSQKTNKKSDRRGSSKWSLPDGKSPLSPQPGRPTSRSHLNREDAMARFADLPGLNLKGLLDSDDFDSFEDQAALRNTRQNDSPTKKNREIAETSAADHRLAA